MRQSDSVSEELDTENVQCALDFENTMNELETQLYYRHLPPKEVALRVMEAACKFYDADWCGLIQVDQAPCQGRGRGCSFHGIPRSHQPGGSGLQL